MVNIKVDFKDYQKDRNFIRIKGSIHQERITVPKSIHLKEFQKYMMQTLTELKGEIDKSTVITGHYSL